MNLNEDSVATARKRYAIISAVRLAGGAMLVLGLAVIANGLMDLPVEAGYALFAAGVFGFIAAPAMLSRRWKSSADK
jgi:hypothetical protein